VPAASLTSGGGVGGRGVPLTRSFWRTVIRRAERDLDFREALLAETEELRRLWREGVESGPAGEGPAVFARLRRRYARDRTGAAPNG
jgi:hypothetical protein